MDEEGALEVCLLEFNYFEIRSVFRLFMKLKLWVLCGFIYIKKKSVWSFAETVERFII